MKNKLYNILMCDDIVGSINDNITALVEMIPEIEKMMGFMHNHPHHHLDVWGHTLLALSLSPDDFIIRVSILLHDIGKPHCYQDCEVRHFHGHAVFSSRIACEILNRLEFNRNDIERITYLVMEHDTPISNTEIKNDVLLAKDKFMVQVCDALAHNPETLDKRIEYINKINDMINTGDEKEIIRQLILKIS